MEQIGFELAETSRVMRREFDRRAATLGVTRAQWRVLLTLARESGVRQVDLADALDVEPITLCRMIDRLEESGLVERHRDEVDRRAWNIHLTAAAGPIIEGLNLVGKQFMDDALTGICPNDQAVALRVLQQIRDNLASSGAAARAAS